jgi:hypothetical protein
MAAVVRFCRKSDTAAWRRRLAGTMLLCAFTGVAWAADEGVVTIAEAAPAGVAARPAPRIEVSASTLPRLDGIDGSRASRIDMTLLSPASTGVGLLVGLNNPDRRASNVAAGFASASSAIDLGLRWRHSFDGSHQIDITAWRRLAQPDASSLALDRETSYGARVEMNMSSAARSGFVADRGFLGFQMESGARITLRKGIGGKPMFYYRNKF